MIKKIFYLIIALFALFVAWMNLTPGHFQEGCCGISYSTEENCKVQNVIYCTPQTGLGKPMNQLALKLAILDFNR